MEIKKEKKQPTADHKRLGLKAHIEESIPLRSKLRAGPLNMIIRIEEPFSPHPLYSDIYLMETILENLLY